MSAVHCNLRETHQIGQATRQQVVWSEQVPALTRLGVAVCGTSDAAEGFCWVRQRPDMSQVLVCSDGQGEVWTDGGWRLCTAGMAYLSPPRTPHAYRACSLGRWQVAWVIWPELRGVAAAVAGPLPSLIAVDPRPLQFAIQGLYQETLAAADGRSLELWAELVDRSARRFVGQGGHGRLWRVWAEVDADLGHAWSIADLASLAGMSGEHLRRCCLKDHGEAPLSHLTRLRLERAASLLATSDSAVAEIAGQVGYTSAFAFTNAFKRFHGLAPQHWREAR